MEHPVRWIMTVEICMARLSGVEDRYSFRLVLQHTLTIYVWFLLCLDSRTIISSSLRWNTSQCNFLSPFKKKEEKGKSPPPPKKKVKEKRKRKENNHAPFQSRLGTQMFLSLHKLNGFTSRRHLDILWSRLHRARAWLIATEPMYSTYEGQGGGSGLAWERNMFVSLSLNQCVTFTTIYGYWWPH